MESFAGEVTYSRYLVAATDTADEKAKQESWVMESGATVKLQQAQQATSGFGICYHV